MERQKPKTAAWRLFHIKYPMRIPQIFMYGQAYLEKHGYHVSGDDRLDSERLMEPTIMRQTAVGLAIFHEEGAPIDIVNHRDSVAIYDDIQEHLRDWERESQHLLHEDDLPPLKDFRMLEAIALELHTTAKNFEPNEVTGDPVRDRIMEMNRRRNPVRTERYLRGKITDEQGQLKPYVSIVDRIERNILGEHRWQ